MSESSLSIYRRSEGYYMVISAKTTSGLWQHVAERPAFLEASTEAGAIGRKALSRLADPRPTTIHPQRDEWTQVSRDALDPIIRSAKVRSWRAFISKTRLVEVERTNDFFRVTPMKAMPKPHAGFEPELTHEKELRSPSAEELGWAILQALTVASSG